MQKFLLLIWMIFTITSVFNPKVYAVASYSQEQQECKKGNCDQEEKESDPQQISFQIDRTVYNTFQIGFHADLSFEFELPLVVDNSLMKTGHIPVEPNDYFKTLFFYIISPNAP